MIHFIYYICPMPKGEASKRVPTTMKGWKNSEELIDRSWRVLSGAHAQKRTISKADLMDKVYEHGGNATAVALELGVSRGTVLDWLKKDGNMKEYDQIQEVWNDLAEMQLNNQVMKGELAAIMFRLKTKAKDRGYFEKVESTVQGTIHVTLEQDDLAPLGEGETINMPDE